MKAKIVAKLKPNQALVTVDWRMKWLATTFREFQGEWFAKAGMISQGVMVVIKVVGDDGKIQYHTFTFHHVRDDKVEDGFASLSSLAQAIVQAKKKIKIYMKHICFLMVQVAMAGLTLLSM